MRFFLFSILLFAASSGLYADMREADQVFAEKDYPAAIAAYQAVLAQDPDDLVAMRQLGASYYNSGDKARSLGVYEMALVKKTGDAATQRFVDALKAQGVTALPYEAPAAAAPAVSAPRRKYGVRAGLGFGLPVSASGVGSDLGTGGAYSFGMGGGLTSNGEFLWTFHPILELGVGLQFIGNAASYSSKDSVGQAETYKITSSVTPIDLTLYAIIPYSEKLNWVLGFGPAIAVGSEYDIKEEQSYSVGWTAKTSAKVGLDAGLGYHSLLGAEYKFSPGFSLLAGLDLETISLARSSESGTVTTTNAGGALISSLSYDYEYVTDAPKLKAMTTTVNGSVTTTDDGVEVHTYDGAKQTSKKKLPKTSTVDFSRLAPLIKATYRF